MAMREDGTAQCDFCFNDAKYDFKTTLGPWAYGCQKCWERWSYGKLGVGQGQTINPDGTTRFAAGPRG
jgi:hypothetical protein